MGFRYVQLYIQPSPSHIQKLPSIQVDGGMEEWRGLKLKVLRQRIQRLVVLMDLSEPGTVPDPGMLASLIDLVCVCFSNVYVGVSGFV